MDPDVESYSCRLTFILSACGDSVIDSDEVRNGVNFGDQDFGAVTQVEGTLSCTSSCNFDTYQYSLFE